MATSDGQVHYSRVCSRTVMICDNFWGRFGGSSEKRGGLCSLGLLLNGLNGQVGVKDYMCTVQSDQNAECAYQILFVGEGARGIAIHGGESGEAYNNEEEFDLRNK